MKLVMTLLIRDEEDVLRANLDFHLSQGVDFFIVTDNRSVDGSKDILMEYQKRGLLHYMYESEDNYNQHKWVTRMARMAAVEYRADWVINNDADEFWWPSVHASLKEAIESVDRTHTVIEANRVNFVPLEKTFERTKFYEEMIYREVRSFNPLGVPLPPKQAHKASDRIVVHQGNHCVEGLEKKVIKHDLIEIFHFPIRSEMQLLNKIAKGGAAYERNNELPQEVGNTWRKLYERLRKDGNLDHYLSTHIYDESKLQESFQNKLIVEDTRLKQHLLKIYAQKATSR